METSSLKIKGCVRDMLQIIEQHDVRKWDLWVTLSEVNMMFKWLSEEEDCERTVGVE